MPRILAIDWDRNEGRAVLLHSGPTGTSVAGVWAVPLDVAEGTATTGKHVGSRLAEALSGQSLAKVTTIVGVGRDHLQMKLLALPPAPAEELPEMVRFQAEREFTALGDDAALDFVPIAGDVQTPHQVLAVALGPAGMTEVREVCQAIGVEPERITLRSSAAAALVHRAGVVDGGEVALVVNPLSDEADLTVLVGGQLVLMRTVRLPGVSQTDARHRALASEIRRTLAAARQQLADRRVDQIFLCGSEEDSAQAAKLAEELGIAATLFNPVEHAPGGADRHGAPAASLGRLAAVLGMATSEADRRPPVVDFLHVRRRVAVRRFTRSHALAAAGAAALVLLFVFYLWNNAARLNRELADVQQQIVDLRLNVEQSQEIIRQAEAIDAWLATDITWLDALAELGQRLRPEPFDAEEFPVSSDIVTQQLTMLRPPATDAAVGRIDLRAVAKNSAAVAELERRLRDERHRVSTAGGRLDSSLPGYEWSFGLDVDLVPPPAEEAMP